MRRRRRNPQEEIQQREEVKKEEEELIDWLRKFWGNVKLGSGPSAADLDGFIPGTPAGGRLAALTSTEALANHRAAGGVYDFTVIRVQLPPPPPPPHTHTRPPSSGGALQYCKKKKSEEILLFYRLFFLNKI